MNQSHAEAWRLLG